MRPLVLATLLTAAALGAAGCMVNPVSGKSELSLISPSREKEIGKEAAKQIEAEMGFIDDKRLADYVSQVGKRLDQSREAEKRAKAAKPPKKTSSASA